MSGDLSEFTSINTLNSVLDTSSCDLIGDKSNMNRYFESLQPTKASKTEHELLNIQYITIIIIYTSYDCLPSLTVFSKERIVLYWCWIGVNFVSFEKLLKISNMYGGAVSLSLTLLTSFDLNRGRDKVTAKVTTKQDSIFSKCVIIQRRQVQELESTFGRILQLQTKDIKNVAD